jgi:fibronectin type 3 domain-containing protein
MVTRLAALMVLLLNSQSVLLTKGQPALVRMLAQAKQHSVTLTWKASPSHISGYNVYRKSASETDYHKINSSPVTTLTYIDKKVESGATYHYMVRSVDAQGHESVNSQEFTVVIP